MAWSLSPLLLLPRAQLPPAYAHQNDHEGDEHHHVSRGEGHTAELPLAPDKA